MWLYVHGFQSSVIVNCVFHTKLNCLLGAVVLFKKFGATTVCTRNLQKKQLILENVSVKIVIFNNIFLENNLEFQYHPYLILVE